jgi:hypothetical protein
MGETQGTTAFGTLLKIGDGSSPETFTEIAEVNDISGPELSREFAEFTHHASPNKAREYRPTLKNIGSVTFKCNFLPDDATQGFATTGIIKDYNDGALRNYKLAYPDSGATICSFSAYVEKVLPGAPLAGGLALDVTLKITGDLVWA